jgi:hypothetical protein
VPNGDRKHGTAFSLSGQPLFSSLFECPYQIRAKFPAVILTVEYTKNGGQCQWLPFE